MTMEFSILGSSSSGNSALLATENSKILIDAGFSCKRLCEKLEAHKVDPSTIDAIFVTHEHSDHSAGISTFCKRFGTKAFANSKTAQALQPRLKNRPDWQIFNTGSTFQFRDITIENFSIPHDAHDPVGFKFTAGTGDDLFTPMRSVAWLTDLGFAPKRIADRIQDVDALVIESNYDIDMLEMDERRPWSLKQRISGRHGHLSNEASRDLLQSIRNPSWKRVFLAHLSRDCNSEAAIDRTFSELRSMANFEIETISAGKGSALAAV